MSKQDRRRRKKQRVGGKHARRTKGAPQSRVDTTNAGEMLTVFWMLLTVAAAAAEVLLAALVAFDSFAALPAALRPFTAYAHFVALIAGGAALLVLPLVYAFRQTPPPRSVAIVSGLIALLPFALLAR